MPGPGAYDGNVGGNGPAYSMGHRGGNQGAGSIAPGPGNYDPNIDAMKQRAPGVGMSKGPRSNFKAGDGPAPGDYNYQPKQGGGFSMGIKPKDRGIGDAPGPGAYDGDFSKVREKAPGVKMGNPSPSKGFAADTPGPGNYD